MSAAAPDLIPRLQAAVGPRIRIDRELGGGGMSRVFLATDLSVPRTLVVKVLPPEQAPVLHVELFRREIQIAASLQHPNIVPVLTAGELDGLPWYTMQFVEGSTLRERMESGPIPVAEAIRILRDLTRAVAYAHRRDIIHRDLKPENILISDGVPMVTDFGIAKALSHVRGAEQGTSATAGIAFGTPPYMAPEQMAAEPAMDQRMDLYALGVIAFEMFAGTRPFTGSPQEMYLAKMTEAAPDLGATRPDVPPPIAALVQRCLEPDPQWRPQTAAEVLAVLEDVASHSYEGMLPLLGEPRRIRRAVLQYLASVVVVGGLAWLTLRIADVPDWVLPGALGTMALAFPLVLLTAVTRYTAHHAMARHAWHPSALEDITEGGLRSLAIRWSRSLGWREVRRGTLGTLGAFVLLVVGYSVMRAAGIGAPGTLAAAGVIAPNQRLLVTDFGSAPADSTPARLAAEAVRVALGESRLVNVMTPQEVAEALQRMQQATQDRLTLAVARELARREGVPVIVDGDLARGANGLTLIVRLVEAGTGTTRAVFTEHAREDTELLAAAARAVRSLRTKLGDSFRDVRAAAALPQVTTASLEALELYARGTHAWLRENNESLALDLFKQAVAIDSGFASAWRSISFLAAGNGDPALGRRAAATALRHRQRAPLRERLLIEASYYSAGGAPDADIAKAVAAYEALHEATGRPHNNHAWMMLLRKEYVEAERLYRIVLANEPDGVAAHNGLFWTLMNLRRFDEADSLAAYARARFPSVPLVRGFSAEFPCALGDERGCLARLDSAVSSHPSLSNRASRLRATMAIRHGRLAEARKLWDQAGYGWIGRRFMESAVDIWIRGQHEADVGAWEPVFTERTPPNPNTWMGIATHLAAAGRPDLARQALQRFDAAVPDSMRGMNLRMNLSIALGETALAERRYADAIAAYRAVETHPIDRRPVFVCGCVELSVGQTFDAAQQPDSAIFWLEAFIATPHFSAGGELDAIYLAPTHERLGQLYAAKNDRANAIRHFRAFVDLWQNADPELQPRVRAAREQLRRLGEA